MTPDKLTDFKQPRASVLVDETWIEAHLWINDMRGAGFLNSRPDDDARVAAAETALRVGLRTLGSADHNMTEQLLDVKLAQMIDQAAIAAETTLVRASAAFEDVWAKRVDEEFAARLNAHSAQIEERLQSLFGEGSDKSVQMGIRRFLADYQGMIAKAMSEDRMRLRRDISELLSGAGDPNHPLAKISTQLTELRKEIAVELEAARAAVAARQVRQDTPRGGFDYQAEVHAEIVALMQGSDDEVDLKGRSPGATGGADGDIVILVDPRLTGGTEARVAVEVTKQSAGLSAAKLKSMLKKAMEDRAAPVAVIVIQDPKILGGQRLAFFPGLGAVVVWEPTDPDEYRSLPLLVGIKHARAIAVREVRPLTDQRNEERVQRASMNAKQTIGELSIVLSTQARIIKLAQTTYASTSQIQRAAMDALNEIDDALSE